MVLEDLLWLQNLYGDVSIDVPLTIIGKDNVTHFFPVEVKSEIL